MRLFLSAALLAALAACGFAGEGALPAERRAEDRIAKGQFVAGEVILINALAEKGASVEQRARLTAALARFYEERVGNLDEALKANIEILNLGLPEDHPAKVAARKRAERLRSWARRYAEEDALLEMAGIATTDSEELEARVVDLRALIARRPDYPRLARAHYHLGDNLLSLKRYGEAYQAFSKARELRPGLSRDLPVEYNRREAYNDWMRDKVSMAVRGLLGLLLASAALLFYLSRPWRRLGLRHVLVLAAVLLCWWGLFALASRWSGRWVAPSQEDPSAFLYSAPGSPGSGPLDTLFLYGLVGVLGSFILAVGTSRFRLRWTSALVTASGSLLLCGCLMTVFYLRYVDREGWFERREKGRLPYSRGAAYFDVPEIEPFMLTEPRAFLYLESGDIDDAVLREWFQKHTGSAPAAEGDSP